MKVFKPENNPVHDFKIVSNVGRNLVFTLNDFKNRVIEDGGVFESTACLSDLDRVELLIDGVSVFLDYGNYKDGYLSGKITFDFEEGRQYKITTNPDIYKGKAFATDQSDLDGYVINPVNGNVIDL
ncbi:hypothetical protein P12024L_05 [Nonlabens phage P12024L]|uniref:Uncharacterized protein n=2 Tax=Inhavirus TaxID=1982244 RepID=I6S6R3_9CAUD|nr:hypothetical protein B617_gp05 [Nonlabens phage P12024S]YP_006560404.1 hypothetical protein B618_gp05 [Nonlabens phage P12024L]AFM54666.1 hypothetical protein P12024S_05 [Nonlabens phage P12024S]AFM54725.1 hypothetical protein P12024L_05 [Nonlabens phage P12024L]